MKVPLFDPGPQVQRLNSQLLAAIKEVLESGQYIMGPQLEAFEEEIARYLGVKNAIGVGNGTDALWLALKSLGIGPGDRVITTSFTFFATASAIINAGAEPVFADIDQDTFNLDPQSVIRILNGTSPVHRRLRIDPKTIKAIIPVHIYGQPADMGPLLALCRQHGLYLVEDAAQGLGAEYQGRKVGTLGILGCFSFFPTKNLGALGDGGLVVTESSALAGSVRMLRAHGSNPKYHHHRIGINSRLDAVQAAALRVKLTHVDTWIALRQAYAQEYDDAIHQIGGLIPPFQAPERTHTYHQYTIRVLNGRREALHTHLKRSDVEGAVYYAVPLHLQPALGFLRYQRGDFSRSERAAEEVLSLPIFPGMARGQRDQVVRSLEEFVNTGAVA